MDVAAAPAHSTRQATVTCNRCGMALKGGLTSHRKACLRLPRPDRLAEIFLSGQYTSTEAMALHYKVSTGFLEARLLLGGVDSVLIDETREWETHAVRAKPYAKCGLCEIYVIPDDCPLPPCFNRAINRLVVAEYDDPRSGRRRKGPLCVACHEGR